MPSALPSAVRAITCALVLAAASGTAVAKAELNDLFQAGGHVVVDQPVTGDASLAGGSVELRAPVSDRARVAGGEVLVNSAVGGKLLAAGGKVRIGPDAAIGGDARVYGGDVAVDGRIAGDLHVAGGQVSLNGQVLGNVVASGGSIALGPQARIGGTLRYSTRGELAQASGAVVTGAVVRGGDGGRSRDRDYTVRFSGRGFGLAAFALVLGVAALLLRVAPRFAARAAERTATSPAAMVGMGFVTLVAVPVAMLLLLVTIVGIPLAIVLGAALPLVFLLAFTLAVLGLGRRLPGWFKQPHAQRWTGELAWFALALAAVMVVGSVPVLGWLGLFLFLLAGLGAFVLELPRRRPAPPGGAPSSRTVAA